MHKIRKKNIFKFACTMAKLIPARPSYSSDHLVLTEQMSPNNVSALSISSKELNSELNVNIDRKLDSPREVKAPPGVSVRKWVMNC